MEEAVRCVRHVIGGGIGDRSLSEGAAVPRIINGAVEVLGTSGENLPVHFAIPSAQRLFGVVTLVVSPR